MADLRRLIWFVVGVMLVSVPMIALADTYPASWGTPSTVSHWQNSTAVSFSTAEAACRSYSTGIFKSSGTYTQNTNGVRTDQCVNQTTLQESPYAATQAPRCYYGGTLQNQSGTFVCVSAPACPEGEQRNTETGQCVSICQAGSTWNGTTCENPCQAKAGNSYGTANNWARLDVASMPSSSGAFCDGQCTVTGGAVECVSSTVAGSTSQDQLHLGTTCTVQGPFKYTGDTCSQSGTSPMLETVETPEVPWWQAGTEAKDCASSGGAWGQVNGLDVCVRAGTGETVQNEVSTSNGTGTTTTTTNPDGTTTETTTTKGTSTSGDKATETTTTTTVTKDAAGNVTDTQTTISSTEKPVSDFCKENPAHASCVGTETGGKWAGSCAAGFTCSGDAVQCAIAKTLHQEKCENAVSSDVLAGFEGIKSFVGTGEGEGLDRKTIQVAETLSVAEIGGGAGLQDMTVTVMGQSIEIPFSEINRFIEMMGYAIMMIAWLQAFRIIAGVM